MGCTPCGSGPVTVTGGTFTAGASGFGLYAAGSGLVTVTGGTFTAGASGDGLLATGSSLVTITGGTFSATGAYGFGLRSAATIDVFGSGFSYTVNGVTTPITTGTLPLGAGTLTGTLLNNTGPTTSSYINAATIEINVGTPPAAAPEPSQFAALGVGLLGLAGLTLRARKRRSAA